MVSAAITQLYCTCSDKRAGACLCCERQSGGWPQKPCREWWLRDCPADVWLSRGNPEHRDTIQTGQQSTVNKSGTRSVSYDWKNKRYPKLPNVFMATEADGKMLFSATCLCCVADFCAHFPHNCCFWAVWISDQAKCQRAGDGKCCAYAAKASLYCSKGKEQVIHTNVHNTHTHIHTHTFTQRCTHCQGHLTLS